MEISILYHESDLSVALEVQMIRQEVEEVSVSVVEVPSYSSRRMTKNCSVMSFSQNLWTLTSWASLLHLQ